MSPVDVAYEAHGDPAKPVLVLASSLGTTRAMWDPQVPALAARFRVVRYDHRGHGDSPTPPGPYTLAGLGEDVVGLLDRLGVERAHFCGLSIGGLVGLWVASAHPERIDRLVACCTAPTFRPARQWHDRAATVRRHGLEALADAVVQRWFTPAFAARHPETVAEMRAMLTATPPEGYAGCCEALADADVTDRLERVAAPTLAIAGADDPAAPPEQLERIAGGVADGRPATVDHAAHLANIEQPDRVTELIRTHLNPGAHP